MLSLDPWEHNGELDKKGIVSVVLEFLAVEIQAWTTGKHRHRIVSEGGK